MRIHCAAAGLLMALLAGCQSADRALFPPRAGEPQADIVVFDNHWHTGIILPFADLPPTMKRSLAALSEYPYVAIGWGDTDFFRSPHITPALIGRALFFSRGTVLLVIGLPTEPENAYANSVDVYRIHASRAGYERLVATVAESFEYASGALIDRGPAGEGDGGFYAGMGRYNALRTCNVWTAAALRSAGLPITPGWALTAGNVEYQLGLIPGVLRNGRPIPHVPAKPLAVQGSRRGL